MENKKSTKKTKERKNKISEDSILCVIRIAGEVKVKPQIVETLYRLRLRKKYACILIDSKNKNLLGMLDKVKHSVAYGEIEKETLVNLLKARAKRIDGKKVDAEKNSEELFNGKTLTEIGLKPFFRLHPARGGINSKLIYPLGVLGNHGKDINKLVGRML